MKIFGAIDVGTNSTRLLIAEVQHNQLRTLGVRLHTTRIGQGMGSSRCLCPEAIERTLQVLRDYCEELKRIGVDGFRAVATSAVRESLNPEELLRGAAQFGLKIDVITGEEEARLSFNGATRGLPGLLDPTVLDIGGGSTEFIWDESGALAVYSLPVGAVRLTESPQIPPEVKQTWSEVIERLQGRLDSSLVGVGGTITTLAAIKQGLTVYQPELVHGFVLQQEAVRKIYQFLAGLSLEGRRQVPGLQPERADIILAGTALLLELMDSIGQTKIIVSEHDLLHGLIWSQVEAADVAGR